MTFTVWLSLFTICILGAMSPGPSFAFGIGIYAFVTLIGLAVVLQQSPLLFKTISYAGAGYLAYLGYNALRSKGGVAHCLASLWRWGMS